MKVNFPAIEKFVADVKNDASLAIKTKIVEGSCNFEQGQPHYTATLEFPSGKTTLVCDQPPFMGGGGTAPDPLLYCLYGTASCFAGTMMLIIEQRKLKVDSLRVRVQNKVNLTRPLGLGEAPIVEGVWIGMEYTGEAGQGDMDSAVKEAMETCPGAYCVTHPIPLTAEIHRA